MKISLHKVLFLMSVLIIPIQAKEDTPAQPDSLQEDRAKYVKAVRATIQGKEKLTAEEVFKDIQIMKGQSAGKLLAIMEYGYSHSLGVSCGHCHNTEKWESNEKKEKEIARQMSQMARTINTDLLKKIQGLKSENPAVNCSTCHRGQIKPALDF